jgi:tRNA(Ile)-lysidine synthase
LQLSGRSAGAIGRDEFAGLMAPFAPFESDPVLAVAVSGGRDSLSLALLTKEWAAARGGRIVALIVDHGLRAESAAEAAATHALLATHDIAAEILPWSGEKPASRLQEAARAARYSLLFEACRRHRILHLLVAHHADDQAETVAMRAARASGPDGLAGMAAVVEHRDGRLLRPLLSISRSRLTATLAERRVSWIDDPSNVDSRFERARLRTQPSAPAVQAGAAADRATRERRLAEDAVSVLEVAPPDTIVIDQAAFAGLGRPQAARLLARVTQAVGRRAYPPRRDRLDRAVTRLAWTSNRGNSGKSQDFTLAECRLMLRQESGSHRLRWIVAPENGRKDRDNVGQPLVPAAFFACGRQGTSHLE